MSARSLPSIVFSVGLFGLLSSISLLSLASIYDRYQRTRERLAMSQDQVSALRTQASDKDASLRNLQDALSNATAELKSMREASEALQKSAEDTQKDLLVCRHDLQTFRSTSYAPEQTERTKVEMARLAQAHEQTQKLLKTRTEELHAAEIYLGMADSTSGADVIGMIEALNAEIFQTAATIAETLKFGEKQVEESEAVLSAYGDVVEILGPRMTELLQSSSHQDDQLLIQIALQAAMCAYMEWIVTSWYFEGRDEERLLSNLYSHIRDAEEQAIAGRWRALTRKYAVQACNEGSDIHRQLVDVVMETLVNILISAGLEVAASQVTETIAAQFAGHTSEVVRRATHLNWVIGQTITSCEWAPMYVVPDTDFEVETMEDDFGGTQRDGEMVLCTTSLGLVRTERHGDEWQRRVLRKAGVALQSGLARSG